MAARDTARQIVKLLMEHFSDTTQSPEETLGDFLMFRDECESLINVLRGEGVKAEPTDLLEIDIDG
jgi:hypothetical protein